MDPSGLFSVQVKGTILAACGIMETAFVFTTDRAIANLLEKQSKIQTKIDFYENLSLASGSTDGQQLCTDRLTPLYEKREEVVRELGKQVVPSVAQATLSGLCAALIKTVVLK